MPEPTPLVRLGSPALSGVGVPANPPGQTHPLLMPMADMEDEESVTPPQPAPAPAPVPSTTWYRALGRPAAYVVSGLAGAVLVSIMYVLVASRPPAHDTSAQNPGTSAAVLASDIAALDRRADSLALAVEAFMLRARMFDSRRMGCASLARGLEQVESGWLDYNIARKATLTAADAARDARDRALYADVRAVELRFERSSCTRP